MDKAWDKYHTLSPDERTLAISLVCKFYHANLVKIARAIVVHATGTVPDWVHAVANATKSHAIAACEEARADLFADPEWSDMASGLNKILNFKSEESLQ